LLDSTLRQWEESGMDMSEFYADKLKRSPEAK
jgi:hypothetical protein